MCYCTGLCIGKLHDRFARADNHTLGCSLGTTKADRRQSVLGAQRSGKNICLIRARARVCLCVCGEGGGGGGIGAKETVYVSPLAQMMFPFFFLISSSSNFWVGETGSTEMGMFIDKIWSTVSPVFFGRYPRSSLHSFVLFPPPPPPVPVPNKPSCFCGRKATWA